VAEIIMSKPKISVIIVTKDRPEKLFRCISHITSGSLLPNQLMIVDSSSLPNKEVQQQIRSLCSRLKLPFKYYSIEHKGISFARNFAIRHCTNPYFVFIDDDEIAPHHWLKKITSLIQKFPQYQVFTGPKKPLHQNNYWNQIWQSIGQKNYSYKGPTDFAAAGNSCYQRQFIVKHKIYYEEKMLGSTTEDSVFVHKLEKASGRIYFDSQMYVYHDFRTNLWSFMVQWFNYGKGTYKFSYYYLFQEFKTSYGNFTKLKQVIENYFNSRRYVTPHSFSAQFLGGHILKEIVFAGGYFYSFVSGKH
jgi:glycosyltransferase involved in cell wall biosynthesis